MYTELLQQLGLPKNEALIYETLIRFGESGVAMIAAKSAVNRRNVYDSLKRLQERGLAFETKGLRESIYQAVEPRKLLEIIQEKERLLTAHLQNLEKLYHESPIQQSVHLYRGIEGWKNVMRDIILTKEQYHCIGGKGGWLEPRITGFSNWFLKELKSNKIKSYVLFDQELKKKQHPITSLVGKNYRYLPKGASSQASIEIFGDRVVLVSDLNPGKFENDFTLTVNINQQLADAFRAWFKVLWDGSELA